MGMGTAVLLVEKVVTGILLVGQAEAEAQDPQGTVKEVKILETTFTSLDLAIRWILVTWMPLLPKLVE